MSDQRSPGFWDVTFFLIMLGGSTFLEVKFFKLAIFKAFEYSFEVRDINTTFTKKKNLFICLA